MQNIYYLADIFQFLMGVATVVLASTWKRQAGKKAFIAFVAVAFLAIPSFHLVVRMTMQIRLSSYNGYAYWWLMEVEPIVNGILYLASGVLLLTFAVFRSLGTSTASLARGSESVESGGSIPGPDQWLLIHGRRWETTISGDDLVSIARRREWAWLIDFSPMFLLPLGINLSTFGAGSVGLNRIGAILFLISVCSVPLMMLYWVLKDSVYGVSVGKWLTGCRVVDALTGHPIGSGKSFLRNLLFLVPFTPLVELFVASIRPDRRRLGDLIAGTVVVKGPPKWVDGEEFGPPATETEQAPAKHPLDD